MILLARILGSNKEGLEIQVSSELMWILPKTATEARIPKLIIY